MYFCLVRMGVYDQLLKASEELFTAAFSSASVDCGDLATSSCVTGSLTSNH
jgi:hypothetical protein